MSASLRAASVAGTALALAVIGGCVSPVPGPAAGLPRPIVLSAHDRVTPQTRFQIEQTNRQIEQMAVLYSESGRMPLPLP